MVNKITYKIGGIVIGVSMISLGYGFAATGDVQVSSSSTTGSTSVTSSSSLSIASLQSDSDLKRSALIDLLDKKSSSLSGSVVQVNNGLSVDEDYNVLNKLGLVNVDNPDKKNVSEYYSLKTLIMYDYNNLLSNISILDEKKKLSLLDNTDFASELNKIKVNISEYESKYKSLIDTFFKDGQSRLDSFHSSIESLKKQNSTLLTKLKANKIKLDGLVIAYTNYKTLLSQVNNSYVGNYDTINSFLDDVRKVISDSVKSDLDNVVKNYYSKYVNMDYYSGDIADQENSAQNLYMTQINGYFNQLFSGFYSQTDVQFIDNNMQVFKSKYFIGDSVDYKLLSGNIDLGDDFQKLSDSINNITSIMNLKLAELGNPDKAGDIKSSVKDKILAYHESQKTVMLDGMKKFLDKQAELLSYKTSAELESYNNILKKEQDIKKSYTGADDKYYALNDFQKSIDFTRKNMVNKDLKKQLDSKYWQIESDKIDILVQKGSFGQYILSYGNVEQKLKNILTSISNEFEKSGKTTDLNSRIDKALDKIGTFLSDDKLSKKTKYLLYKIKKVFIWYRYLR